jgi:hypothetical protein
MSPLPALPFLLEGLALRCHVSPSSETKNLPAMKSTREREREDDEERQAKAIEARICTYDKHLTP